ncbi:MAG: DUF1684 domain-containing protein [Verrucomicrobia bacterium]|nr:DUF1684 domain-containing protein [Verrucomicrobiota bacterium]
MRHAVPPVLLALLALGLAGAEPTPYAREIETWRAQRVERLKKPDGWLTLIGLHYLKDGENTVGSAADSTIQLAAGPTRFGTVTQGPDRQVTFRPASGVEVRVDGQPAKPSQPLRLAAGKQPATLVNSGTVTFFLLERGGRLALRVRDSEAERRTKFPGLTYFPLDPSWRIEARWKPFDPPREVPITNIAGQTSTEKIPGAAVFERDGQTIELLPMRESPESELFFVLSDATSGTETYSAARFLYADPPAAGSDKVVLDFNKAYNPPCAFTPFATCPLPPKENQLTIPIRAGEKKFEGEH